LEEKKALLDVKQLEALSHFARGGSGCISGSAGTGKSYVMRMVKEICRDILELKLADTASTGRAAQELGTGAETIHRFVGGAIWNSPIETMKTKIGKSYNAILRRNWRTVQVLIIDEISMLQPDLFSKFEEFARFIRGTELPFGGIQIILSGDYAQLPPVVVGFKDGNEEDNERETFCFESEAYRRCIGDNEFVLRKAYRQMNDPTYFNVLQQIRLGELSAEGEKLLKSRMIKNLGVTLDELQCTVLFAKNSKVDEENQRRLALLPDNEVTFRGVYGKVDKKSKLHPMEEERLKNSLKTGQRVPENLVLKKGAAVVLVANLDVAGGLANGSQGIIKGFDPLSRNAPIVDFETKKNWVIHPVMWKEYPDEAVLETKKSDDCFVFYEQIPLLLAFALTVHRAQGMTIKKAAIDIGRTIFQPGQAYTALSRVPSLDGLYILGFVRTAICANPKVIARENHPLPSSAEATQHRKKRVKFEKTKP
jgi:ATP-dependent DNA helicase PIF1